MPSPKSSPEGDRAFGEALCEAAAAVGRPLSPEEARRLEAHYRLLLLWGRRMNLTGLKDREAILRRHFLEPIAAADLLGERGTLLDLGSGNGFPAIPLKVLHPGLDLVMVEASEKKSSFLWAVAQELGLRGTRVETRRVGGLQDIADLLPCRYLTLRAVRVRPLMRGGRGRILEPGGRALFFLSAEDAESIRRDPVPGLRWAESRPLPSGAGAVVAVLAPED